MFSPGTFRGCFPFPGWWRVTGPGARIFLWLALAVLFASSGRTEDTADTALPEEEVERFHQRREDFFEIYGRDLPSVMTVGRISREAGAVLSEPLLLPNRLPQPILVALRHPDEMRENRPYLLDRAAQDNILVHLRWSAETSLAETREALALALLWRGLLWHRAPVERAEDLPAWLLRAVVMEMGMVRFPSYDEGVEDFLQQHGLPSLAEILESPAEAFARPLDYAAVHLWRFLREEAPQRDRALHALLRITSGEDPRSALFHSFSERVSDLAELELWWQVGGRHLLTRRARIQTSLRVSREILADWSQLTVEQRGRVKTVPVEEWPEYRDLPGMTALLEERINLIARSLNQLHPFHFNPALSLARSIQSIRDEDAARLTERLAEWENDLREVDGMVEELNQLLESWERRSRP